MQSDYDVVTVGAGPIGALTVWGLVRQNPNLRGKILEKYQEPQRKHTLLMQHRQLKKVIDAAIPEHEQSAFFISNDPIAALYRRLQNDARIRTNELQAILLNALEPHHVDIEYTKVEPDTLHSQIFMTYPNVKLVLGADGVKSTINQTLFPPDNQYKQVFDYLLVLRYEVTGAVNADFNHELKLYEQMSHLGIIASEIIGKTVDNKTPVTLQIVISKEDYEPLQSASFKEPITLKNLHHQDKKTLSHGLETFVTNYLAQLSWRKGILSDSIKISAIEAPATAVKQVFICNESTHQVPVVLIGDASLGLSYFKGLNAGLESTAKLLEMLSDQTIFKNPAHIIDRLTHYQNWFLNKFVPKKIKEVALFSVTRVRPLYYLMRTVQFFKSGSLVNAMHSENPFIQNYLNLKENMPSLHTWQIKKYPHRSYDPVISEQFTFVPFEHTLKKITKLFSDYFTPYKSFFHFKHDIQQPLFGIGHLYIGVLKIFLSITKQDGLFFLDGLLTLIRGALEIGLTPLSWTLKPLIRAIITVFSPLKTIETNVGVQRTAKQGLDYLANENLKEYVSEYEEFPPIDLYNLRAVANDLHRKYEKACYRHQKTHISAENEYRLFSNTQDKKTSQQDLENYFSLFNSGGSIPNKAS